MNTAEVNMCEQDEASFGLCVQEWYSGILSETDFYLPEEHPH